MNDGKNQYFTLIYYFVDNNNQTLHTKHIYLPSTEDVEIETLKILSERHTFLHKYHYNFYCRYLYLFSL